MKHVGPIKSRVLDNESEKVWFAVNGLIRDHHRTGLHHPFFDLGRHFVNRFTVLFGVGIHRPQCERNVPETNVGALGLLKDHSETGPRLYHTGEVFSAVKDLIDVLLETLGALCPPHEPEFQHVGPASTLNMLVSGIVLGVIELVLLEQVGGVGGVSGAQQVGVPRQEC